MGKILSIDFGLARIGIAISDENKRMALPLTTVPGGKTIESSVSNVLTQLSDTLQNVEKIVVGLPLNMNGTEGEMALLVRQFGTLLEEKTGIEVAYFDERLTSSAAHKELKGIKTSRKKRTSKVDQIAATMILQSFLDAKQ
ncbi:MAG: Holliday junction resolvase RuvX [Chlamydiae bacterium CG10_big_fil_rev_8_21_14_0_10_35_9]|nr:MAG: Holliday junction resolvase RuvX [Chlamydiae bacterium CG10_big_fil_rev_8_21_14_0_10_35_9]